MNAVEGGVEPTLMQKWRAHWDTRDRIFNPTPEAANRMGVALFWSNNVALMYSVLYVAAADSGATVLGVSCFWWRIIAWFLWFQSTYNWFLTSLKVLSQATGERMRRAFDRHGMVLPSGEHEYSSAINNQQQMGEFETCPVCLLLAPPRSHHCKICNCCVLKRDHHCFFTASCVGFNNQRYFVVFAFYTTISCVVGILLIAAYLTRTGLPMYDWYDMLRFTPPVAIIDWFRGRLRGYQLLLLIQITVSAMLAATGLYFFLWQVHLITRGQTTHEATRGIQRYRVDNVANNLRTVFGPYWILNFLWPLRTLPAGDGVFWQTQKNVKGS